jgi:hypothetical protein
VRRTLRSLAVFSVTPVALALPVLSRPVPRPHAVAPTVREASVSGIDATARAALPGWSATGPATARPLALTRAVRAASFEAIGVTWAPTGDVEPDVVVRVHQGGAWTDWHALDADSDDGPDAVGPDSRSTDTARGVRAGTAPWFTGPADGYQVRVATRGGAVPRDVRVSLVDPGTSSADASLGVGSPASTAAAAIGRPTIYSRAQWGADESLRSGTPDYSDTIKAGFVHHTDTSNSYAPSQAAAMIRSVYAFHVKSRGWSDIGYNFLVDKYGRIFEGRYGGVDRPVIGAHTGGFNTDTFGVSLLGTYTSVSPSAAEVAALERIFAWKMSLHYVNPLGRTTLMSRGGTKYASGTYVTFNNISGHRDAGLTSCPGQRVYDRLPAIRSAVKSYMKAALYTPKISDQQPTYLTTPYVTVIATMPGTQSWNLIVRRARDGARVRKISGVATNSVRAVWNLRDDAGRPLVPSLYDVELQAWTSSAVARPWTTRVLIASPLPSGIAVKGTDGVPYAIVEAGRLVAVTPAMAAAVRPPSIVAYPGSTGGLPSPAAPPRDGMYVSGPGGGTYLVVDGMLRPVASDVASALHLGTPKPLPANVLGLIGTGPDWTSTTRHPDGSVVVASDGTAYRMESGVRRSFTSPAAGAAWSKQVAVAPATSADLARPAGPPLAPPDGVLLRTATGAGVVSDGTFRSLSDPAALGYDPTTAAVATSADLAALPSGPAVGDTMHPSGALLRVSSGYVEVRGTTKRVVDPSLVASDPRVAVSARPGESGLLGMAPWVPPSGLAGRASDGTVRVVDSGRLVTLTASQVSALDYDTVTLPHLEAADFGPLPAGVLNDASSHVAGSVVTDGTAYWLLDAGTRRPLASSLVQTWRGHPALPATTADLALPTGATAPPQSGAWLVTSDGTRWLVNNGLRRTVASAVAHRLGLDAVAPVAVPSADLSAAAKYAGALA